MRKLLGNLIGKERAELLAIGALDHARVEPVHDDGLKLAAEVVVQSIDELLEINGKHDNSAVVLKMKQIVPEFLSKNSTYEQLDALVIKPED